MDSYEELARTDFEQLAGPTRVFNIVSERVKGAKEDGSQTNIDNRYSTSNCSLAKNNEGKLMVSTKAHNSISIIIHDNGKWSWTTF